MTIDKIRELVEHETGYDLKDTKRTRERVYIRSVYFKLCKKNTLASLQKIGLSVNKDHSTVLHGIRLYDETLTRWEKAYVELYNKVENRLRNKKQDKVLQLQEVRNEINKLIQRIDKLEADV